MRDCLVATEGIQEGFHLDAPEHVTSGVVEVDELEPRADEPGKPVSSLEPFHTPWQ